MKSQIITLCLLVAGYITHAQQQLNFLLKDFKTKEPIIGATTNLLNTTIGAASDANGLISLSIPTDNKAIIIFKAMGYQERTDTCSLPPSTSDTPVIYLTPEEEELEEFSVSSTRSSRTIKDIPTRIELLGGEEIDEKGNMKPGDIRMMLSESTGIQTLQTSAMSGNSSIRIQGLDGRYSQILKDGFPLYSGFSGGLGLLQTPPLDLKQVEIIKGASSTLYGGGAIAGLINLISKTPGPERELKFLINGTTALGLDLNGFYSQRFGKKGITLYAAINGNKPFDPFTTGFSAIPAIARYTINPRFFYYPTAKTEISLGLNTVLEKRTGGDMDFLLGKGNSLHSYYEKNASNRYNTQFEAKHQFGEHGKLTFKNSLNYFSRTINAPGYTFDGIQLNSFSEAAYSFTQNHHEWVFGLNLFTDGFTEKQRTAIPIRDYNNITFGGFIQNTYDLSSSLILESGLRTDLVNNYQPIILPRISLLYKVNSHVTSRLGGGLGYKTPSIFTEESEKLQYRNILPVSHDSSKLERSYGANWDVNYKTLLAHDKVSLSINQLVFYTRLNNPLLLTPISPSLLHFQSIDAHIDALGAETNIRIRYKDFRLFLGYTYTSSQIHLRSGISETPLTPTHHTNSVLTYEVENKWKVGIEAYYFSSQRLTDGTRGHDYWLCGFMAEKLWKRCSVFINFENFLNTHQTRFGPLYSGSITSPTFKDIYAPLDGFVANGGLKIRL